MTHDRERGRGDVIINIFKKIKIKKIFIDFGLSIIASSISIIGLQFVVYPTLARIFEESIYGELLTIIGIINIIIAAVGIPLNNTRLIQNTDYQDKDTSGDFNVILMGANLISFMLILILGNTLFDFGVLDNALTAIWGILAITNAYLSVEYRLRLNYKMLIVLNVVTLGGYLLGTFFAANTSRWVYAFLFGELFSFILLIFTTNLKREPFKITPLYNKTLKKYSMLALTGLIANISVYLDRFIIYPVLGAAFVSTFTVASFFGKALGLVMTPISGVLLSYYSQKDFKMTNKKFWGINGIFLPFTIIFFFFAKYYAPWFTGLLYPTIIDSARPYILLANTASIINVMANLVTPMILKYAHIRWQMIIQLTYLVAYFGLSTIFISTNGLIGFCYATIMANSLKLVLLFVAGGTTFRRPREVLVNLD